MAADKEDREEGGFHNPNHNNNISKKGSDVKSCKGYLSYSLRRSKNPTCVGIPRTLHRVPRNTFWETELEASKEGRSQSFFDYSCVGYSVFLNKKDSSSDQQIKRAELPVCTGFEMMVVFFPNLNLNPKPTDQLIPQERST